MSVLDLYKGFPVGRTGGGTTFVDLTNAYIAYLTFANAGMLNKGNLLCIDYAMRNLPSKNPIVEIGSFCGLSTNLLAYFKHKHGVSNPIYNCDKWIFEGADGNVGDTEIPHAEYRAFVMDSYKRNVQMFSRWELPRTIEAQSNEFFTAWGRGESTTDVFGRPARLGGPISFCYIDGNHSYEFAKADFENTNRFLEPGGFVLFDDSADGSKWEVTRVIEEIKQRSDYEFVVKNPNYLFRKKTD
jgi:predicted O-methyltransferase YrrM